LITLSHLRRFAVRRSLFAPTTLKPAIDRLGFVQADPIRAPARAQDLILRHRVKGYQAGDLERRYEKLGVAEDVFINYGFVTNSLQALMHPRPGELTAQTQVVLDFVLGRGTVHPREVNDHFSHGKVTNYWGGSSNSTTQLMESMHYQGLLRVARRESGIRIYAAQQHGPSSIDTATCLDALVDAAVNIYAPLPAASLSYVIRRLRYAAPQWQGELKTAIERAKQRLSRSRIDGIDWYWPAGEAAATRRAPEEIVRLLAPFDPVVWDRDRFELLWGWPYRFEAYTPAPKRERGYYALPLLWRDQVIGWGNLSVNNGKLEAGFGYVNAEPRDRTFQRELEAELHRVHNFLGLES
jgi:uncharacterized protein